MHLSISGSATASPVMRGEIWRMNVSGYSPLIRRHAVIASQSRAAKSITTRGGDSVAT